MAGKGSIDDAAEVGKALMLTVNDVQFTSQEITIRYFTFA
jgi:hypothetical protein